MFCGEARRWWDGDVLQAAPSEGKPALRRADPELTTGEELFYHLAPFSQSSCAAEGMQCRELRSNELNMTRFCFVDLVLRLRQWQS